MDRSKLNVFISGLIKSHPGLSDLVYVPGHPCQFAEDGYLHPSSATPFEGDLTESHTEKLVEILIGENNRLLTDLKVKGSCDFSYEIVDCARFRINVFFSQRLYSIVMRRLESRIPTIQDLGLPDCLYDMASEKNGLILFTGPTGTGKSTSLAAILNEINRKEPLHIITLEDPIEFVHPGRKATFSQRELGQDFDTFVNGLRSALRQAPHVILVGEIRDRETADIAMSAAETGHLVFSTLHTVSAGHTINRILGLFTTEEERQIRFRMADTLCWAVGQRLLPKIEGGREAIFDILRNNLQVKEVILQGESEDKDFNQIMAGGSAYHMQTFDQHILRLFEKRVITEDTAMAFCLSRAIIRKGIDRIKRRRGEKTSDIEGLDIDMDYTAKHGLKLK